MFIVTFALHITEFSWEHERVEAVFSKVFTLDLNSNVNNEFENYV